MIMIVIFILSSECNILIWHNLATSDIFLYNVCIKVGAKHGPWHIQGPQIKGILCKNVPNFQTDERACFGRLAL